MAELKQWAGRFGGVKGRPCGWGDYGMELRTYRRAVSCGYIESDIPRNTPVDMT